MIGGGLIGMIDFDDVFGTDDMRREAFLRSKATESQMKKVWETLEEQYGNKRFIEVMADKYGEE